MVGVETPVEFQSPEPQSWGSAGARSSAPKGRGGWKSLGLPLLTGAVGVGALVLVHMRDPHIENSYGVCPTWGLFGLYCPGCGGMRAAHNLTDGRILDSLHSNLLALPLIVLFFGFVVDWSIRAWRGQGPRLPAIDRTVTWSIFAFIAGYAVLRNTPWGTWLTPV